LHAQEDSTPPRRPAGHRHLGLTYHDYGITIGNSARVLNGIQIGVLNRAQNNRGVWRMLPLLNAHF
jgi:hypothetical protein